MELWFCLVNSTTIIVLYISIFFVTAFLVSRNTALRHTHGYRAMLIFLLAHCIVSLCALLVFAINDFETKVFFSRMRYLGFSLFGPCTLLFINTIYKQWAWLEKKWGYLVLFFPAAITWVITLTPSLQHLLVLDFKPFQAYHLSVLTFWGAGHLEFI